MALRRGAVAALVAVLVSLVGPLRSEDLSDLKLLIALWRHGDRAPLSTYPTDPYKDSEYLPEGEGNLDLRGQLRAYRLGAFFRSRYDSFLGAELDYDTAALRSTHTHRCVESGQLVMAAMYPPVNGQWWEMRGLGKIWDPVTFDTLPSDQDILLANDPKAQCAAFKEDYSSSLEAVLSEIREKYPDEIKYIAKHSGLAENETKAIIEVADTLESQESLGMLLPNWTRAVWPQPMLTMFADMFRSYVYTAQQRKLLAGVFLDTLRVTAESYQNGSLPERRRFYGYSAHDTTIIYMASALGIWNGIQPPFSTALIFELRQINSTELGFKILYHNNSAIEPYELTLPGCDLICPLSKYEELYKDVFLTHDEQESECSSDDEK